MDFGDGAWNSPGDDLGMYLAKFDTDAAVQWSAAYGQGTGWHYPLALDVGGDGSLKWTPSVGPKAG